MHTKKVNIKIQVHYHYENLMKPKNQKLKLFLSITNA